MITDLQPLIVAVALLITAMTPVAVTYLTVQVERIKANLSRQDAALAQHRAEVKDKLEAIATTSATAADAATIAASHTERRKP